MQKLAELCINRPVFATMLIMALVVLGAASYLGLGVDFFPKVEIPTVNVTTTLRGASPEEVETQVTKRIEEAVNTISGIDELRSFSNEGVSQVIIAFVLEKDINVGAQEVRDKISAILSDLPKDADPPIVDKIASDASPVIQIAVSSQRELRETTKIVDDVLKKNLESLSGVGDIRFVGDRQRQIQVWLDGDKLYAYNLNVDQVRLALVQQNVEVPGGRVDQGSREVSLRTLGRVTDPAQFGNIIVATRNGSPIRINDIGRVEDGVEEPRSLSKVNGTPAVVMEIRKQAGTNTLDVIKGIKTRVDSVRNLLPPDFKINYFRDQSDFIQGSFEAVQAHLIEGGLFAALIVLLFLSNWRLTMIAAIAIPTSIISTFALMKWQNFTLNQITMLALVLMVGIVIDDAIVVLENIFRNMEEKNMPPFQAAIEGTREIGLAVLATTLSLVIIFLPVALMPGIVGRFMSSFGYTAAFAIMVSLLVSFTLTPMLSSRFVRASSHQDKQKASSKDRGVYPWIERLYIRMLNWSMGHRWIIVGISFVTVLSSAPLFVLVGKGFLPNDDQSLFEVSVRMAPGSALEGTDKQLREVEKAVRELPGVKNLLTTIGSDQRRQVDRGIISVQLVDPKERKLDQFAIMSLARTRLKSFKDMFIAVQQPSLIQGAGPQQDLQYFIQGPDLEQLNRYAQQIKKTLQQTQGVSDIDVSYESGKPELRVLVNREKAADLNVNVNSIASALRTLVAGDDQVTTYREGDDRYDVQLRVEKKFRDSASALERLYVPSTTLGNVAVSNVATLQDGEGPIQIERTNRQRQILITANFQNGQSLNNVLQIMQKTIDDLNFPPGYHHGPLGQSKEFGRAATAFIGVFIISILFMYMILAAQFESFVDPITILLSLPLSVPFALAALIIFNEQYSIIYSSVGILVLFGIVKKNAILQIDHIKNLRREGETRAVAILHGCRDRLRPILMTTAALVAGMIPLALGGGAGSASRRSVALVVIGGQTMCLLLTLLITPVSYSLFDDFSEWMGRLMGSRRQPEPSLRPEANVALGD